MEILKTNYSMLPIRLLLNPIQLHQLVN